MSESHGRENYLANMDSEEEGGVTQFPVTPKSRPGNTQEMVSIANQQDFITREKGEVEKILFRPTKVKRTEAIGGKVQTQHASTMIALREIDGCKTVELLERMIENYARQKGIEVKVYSERDMGEIIR